MSTRKKGGFNKSLKLTNFSLTIAGISIFRNKKSKLDIFVKNVYYLNNIWLYTDVFPEMFWLFENIQNGKSFIEISFIIPCMTISILSSVKCTPLFLKNETIHDVLDKLRAFHEEFDDEEPADDLKEEDIDEFKDNNSTSEVMTEAKSKKIEKKIVKDGMKLLNFFILLLFYPCMFTTVAFPLLPLASMYYEKFSTGEMKLQLPFLVNYIVFDPFKASVWPFVYVHQVWSTCIACANVYGTDSLLYALCAYIHINFCIISHRFEHMMSWSYNTRDEVRRRLIENVRRHQDLITIVGQVQTLYSESTLFNFVISSFLICLSAFNITFLDDIGAVVAFLTFLTMNISQISLMCFFGDMLMRSSSKVLDAVSRCPWYDADEETKKSILMVIIRAQKPCKLTAANFGDLTLTAFTTVMSRSWSYFALLKTMMGNKEGVVM